MSSMQWRGGSGTSSVASVILICAPHTEQRYFRLTLRISPSGGGGGSGGPRPRSNPTPTLISTPAISSATTKPTKAPMALQANDRPGQREPAQREPADRRSAQALDDGGVRQAAAFAHRLQAVAAARALELVDERRHETGARAAQWMPEGDGPPVDIDLLHVRVVLLGPRQHDR